MWVYLKKKVQIFFSCWWSWSLIFFGITDALNLFFGRDFWVNMFSFLKSYIHFGWCCWEVLKSTSLRSFQEILRNIGHPNHFLSVFLLISAAIAFAIMWQNFPQQLRLRRRLYRLLHQLCLTLSLLFFEHFFQLLNLEISLSSLLYGWFFGCGPNHHHELKLSSDDDWIRSAFNWGRSRSDFSTEEIPVLSESRCVRRLFLGARSRSEVGGLRSSVGKREKDVVLEI